ncbi:hypothetical protein BH23ACT11_BH23ACT11_01070 [soil metagenome]
MNRLRKFLRLPYAERWLLIKAALLLAIVRLGMQLLPFQTLRRLVDRLSKPSGRLQATDRSSIEEIVWAVELSGRYMPGTCLTRALAAQILLARRGYPVSLHIGAVREEGEKFLAHAWLETGGRVVIGGHELERYTPLITLKGG